MNGVPCSIEQVDLSMVSLSVQCVSGWSVLSLFYAVIAARSTGDDTGAVGGLVPRLNGGEISQTTRRDASDTTEYLLDIQSE